MATHPRLSNAQLEMVEDLLHSGRVSGIPRIPFTSKRKLQTARVLHRLGMVTIQRVPDPSSDDHYIVTLNERAPLDVWLAFEPGANDPDDEAVAEANTFRHGAGFVVEWYWTAVGIVRREFFHTYTQAERWLIQNGFENYSPGES